jgi:hypothetical protein
MYDQILRRIPPRLQEKVYPVLAWVSHTERPLTLQEITLISSLHWDWGGFGSPILDEEFMRVVLHDPEITGPLAGLIYTYPIAYPYAEGELSRTGVRLTHVSVKEFLEKEGHNYRFLGYTLEKSEARRFIANVSLALVKKWLALRAEPGSDVMENSKDVGQLATVFDLAWPK